MNRFETWFQFQLAPLRQVNQTTGAVHQLITRFNTARNAALASAAELKQATDQLDAAVVIMARERRVSAESRRGEAVASQFQARRCRLTPG
jgi:hypothetical protein